MVFPDDGSACPLYFAPTMRMPIRSETEAVRFVFGGVAVIVVSVVLGLLLAPVVGVLVFVLACAIAAVAYLRAANPDQQTPLRDAESASKPHGSTRHVLVVANATLAGEELAAQIRSSTEPVEVALLAPVLTPELHYAMSDVDAELSAARTRLELSLAWAKERGIVAHGQVGDPNPTTAIADQLRDFGPDEVIVVTHPGERETWQERDELERLRRELDVPVTHVVA